MCSEEVAVLQMSELPLLKRNMESTTQAGAGLGQVGALQPHADEIVKTLLAAAQVASPLVADTACGVLTTLLSQLCNARLRLDAVPHTPIPGSPGATHCFLFFVCASCLK